LEEDPTRSPGMLEAESVQNRMLCPDRRFEPFDRPEPGQARVMIIMAITPRAGPKAAALASLAPGRVLSFMIITWRADHAIEVFAGSDQLQ
jgi:hypothetical protein